MLYFLYILATTTTTLMAWWRPRQPHTIINTNTTNTSTNTQATQGIETAMAAAAGARDATRLELPVCFFYCFYYYIYIIFLYYVYFRLISTYEGINEDSRHDASRVLRYVFSSIFLIILTSIHRYYANDSEWRHQEPERQGRDMGPGVKWEAWDASARLEPLGMYIHCILVNYQ
jgi:hypothetical protein